MTGANIATGIRASLASVARLCCALAIAVAVLVAVVGGALAQLSEPKFPALTGRIVDEAGLLSAADRAAIEADLAQLESKSTDQLAVVTVRSLQGYDIADYGYRLGRAWGIGQKGKNNGILLIVAPNERKVRIEVGRGLEPVMTDLMSSLVVNNAILPRFRRGDFSGGIRAGVTDIRDVLLGDAEAVKERARGARKGPAPDYTALIVFAIWLGIVLFVIYAQRQQMRQQPADFNRQRRRHYRDDNIIIIPGGGSGHWGGGWSGGSGGGGGWSGGGGDFGGGGSSGSW